MASVPVIESLVRNTAAPGFRFQLSGTADPNSSVHILQAGQGEVGETTADAGGNWSFVHGDSQLTGGVFQYRASVFDNGDPLTSSPQTFKPNIVLINADDMRSDELQYMPFVSQVLTQSGTLFNNAFTPTSLSGPSRASLFTGLYPHNTGVLENAEPLGGDANRNDTSTLATWLDDAGYRTALVGKYETLFNNLESTDSLAVPPGWDEWYARVNGAFYDLQVSDNGVLRTFGNLPSEYSTDLFSTAAQQFIQMTNFADESMFLYFAPFAPHSPFIPAPRDAGAYADLPNFRPDSYNQIPAGNNRRLPISNDAQAFHDASRQRHLESLLGVDDSIAAIYGQVVAAGQTDNTVWIFVGDNGLMWGEHGIASTKDAFYEESIRVPLLIVDGRDPVGRTTNDLALMIDFAPTLTALAGTTLPAPVDGINIAPSIYGGPSSGRDSFLLEHWWTPTLANYVEGDGDRGFGIRTPDWKYIEYASGRQELFDLQNDPSELTNQAANAAFDAIKQQLQIQLTALRPSDTAGPLLNSLSLVPERQSDGMVRLRLRGVADDRTTGGSEVRTPSYYLDHAGIWESGTPLDTTDGVFDSNRESIRGLLPNSFFAQLGEGTHTIYAAGRDLPGNWGPTSSLSFYLPRGPRLTANTDTGASDNDGITLSSAPVLVGTAAPGATVELFAVDDRDAMRSLGTTIATGGSYSLQVTLPAGRHRIFAAVTSPNGGDFTITAASTIWVAALLDGNNSLQVRGTDEDDLYFVNTINGQTTVFVNGLILGTVPPPNLIVGYLLDGDDTITVNGPTPSSILGMNGNDVLVGGSGRDVLDGGRDVNELRGREGNDRYVFRTKGASSALITKILDRIWETPGEGTDQLDFSTLTTPTRIDLRGDVLARYDDFLTDRVSRSVLAGDSSSRSFETIIGSKGSDWLTGFLSTKFTSGSGDDRFYTPDVPVGNNVPLRLFDVRNVNGTPDVRVVLDAEEGALQIKANVAGGLTEADITGNGTNSVVIRSTVAKINATFTNTQGVIFHPLAQPQGTGWITSQLFADLGGPAVDTDRIALRLVAPTFADTPAAHNFVENGDPLYIATDLVVTSPGEHLGGGQVSVAFLTQSDAADTLRIVSEPAGANVITVYGSEIWYAGTLLGTIRSLGVGGQLLLIDLEPTALAAGVQRMLRQLTFQNNLDQPSAFTRRVQVVIVDDGGTSTVATEKFIGVTPVNDAPGDPTESQLRTFAQFMPGGGPVRITALDIADPKKIIADPEQNFAGGLLTVSFLGFRQAIDALGVNNEGQGPNLLRVENNSLFYGNTEFATILENTVGQRLRIRFGNDATVFSARKLLDNITFNNPSVLTDLRTRAVKFTLEDGAGAISTTALLTVTIAPRKPAAVFSPGAPRTYTENAPPLFFTTTTQLAAIGNTGPDVMLTVTALDGFRAEDRLTFRDEGPGATTLDIDETGNLVLAGQTIGTISPTNGVGRNMQVRFNAGIPWNSVRRVLRNLSFDSPSNYPGAQPRTVELAIDDGRFTSVTVATILVKPLNDAPVITGGGSVGYQLNSSPIAISDTFTFDDADSPNLAGGILRVRIAAGAEPKNLLTIGGAFILEDQNVVLEGVTIGTLNAGGGAGNTTLIVTLNANATPQNVGQLIRAIRFRTIGSSLMAPRDIDFWITDGDGGTSNRVTRRVNIS